MHYWPAGWGGPRVGLAGGLGWPAGWRSLGWLSLDRHSPHWAQSRWTGTGSGSAGRDHPEPRRTLNLLGTSPCHRVVMTEPGSLVLPSCSSPGLRRAGRCTECHLCRDEPLRPLILCCGMSANFTNNLMPLRQQEPRRNQHGMSYRPKSVVGYEKRIPAEAGTLPGTSPGTRTRNPLIKSQLLYH